MGSATMSMVDMAAVRGAYDEYGADEVYIVHNHPSGNLKPSIQDQQLLGTAMNMFEPGVVKDGIIIDVTSGRYSTFATSGRSLNWTSETPESEVPYNALRFDAKNPELKETYDSTEPTIIRGANDVAGFVADKRLGAGPKISFLLLSQRNQVTGNFITDYESYEGNEKQMAEDMVRLATKYGARNVIPFGNVELTPKSIKLLSAEVSEKSGKSVGILDVLQVTNGLANKYESAQDSYMLESGSDYGGGKTSASADGTVRENSFGLALSAQSETDIDIRFREVEELGDRFDKEIDRYERGELPSGHRFELGTPSAYLKSAGFPNLPISMRASLLARKAGDEKHPFEPADIIGLVKAIQKPIAIFEYSKPNMRNLIVDVKRGDKHFLVGVTLNYKAGDIEINSVSGLFPKESHEWVKWIQDGKAIRMDQKEKVQEIIASLRTNPAESARIGLNLDNVAKIVEKFENPAIESEENSDIRLRKADRQALQTSPEAKISHAEGLSKKFNTPVRIVTDVKELPVALRDKKGAFDVRSGEVVVVIPNHESVEDVAETVFHEVVAHRGLREMIGEENYDAFCDEIYDHLKEDLKKEVDEETTRRFVNDPEKGYEHARRVAVDELFGRMAEKGFEDFTKAERGVWAKLKAKVLEAINKFLGALKLPKWVKLGDNELRYMLWRSHERLRSKGDYVDMARDAAKREELGLNRNEAIRVREDFGLTPSAQSVDEVNRRFNEQLHQQSEGRLSDSHIYKLGKPS
ncbi:MAG: hypothetical protein K2N91_09110, partial [Muribaculaceae bacterium]|nr:hypothetical protein [Muribaculaceae bacterium]